MNKATTVRIGCFNWLEMFLTGLFVVLKLANAITWPWLWVVSPAWIGFLLFAAANGMRSLIKQWRLIK